MRPRHRVSRNAIELIKRFEGYRRKAAQLPDGRWTIGYGHTLTAREGAEVSEPDAEALLLYDLIAIAHALNETVYAPLGRNQFDALCSFAFNIGLEAFQSSQVLKHLNSGEALQAACAMGLWRKAAFEGDVIVIDALVRRRAAEEALFLAPDGGAWVPAPSAVLRPLLDEQVGGQIPAEVPVAVETAMTGDAVRPQRAPLRFLVDEDEGGVAVRAAAESVTARLQTVFIEPDPDPGHLGPPQREPVKVEVQGAAFAFPADEPHPSGLGLDIPPTPPGIKPDVRTTFEVTPFIPARKRAAHRRQPRSLMWDILLGLLGVVFFGFGAAWGVKAREADNVSALAMSIAWLAGVAGVIVLAVAVYRLLGRLARTAEI